MTCPERRAIAAGAALGSADCSSPDAAHSVGMYATDRKFAEWMGGTRVTAAKRSVNCSHGFLDFGFEFVKQRCICGRF